MITLQFSSIAEAEAFLQSQGFHLIADTCDWTNVAGDDAGCYAIYGRDGEVMGWRVEINPAGPINGKRISGSAGRRRQSAHHL